MANALDLIKSYREGNKTTNDIDFGTSSALDKIQSYKKSPYQLNNIKTTTKKKKEEEDKGYQFGDITKTLGKTALSTVN